MLPGFARPPRPRAPEGRPASGPRDPAAAAPAACLSLPLRTGASRRLPRCPPRRPSAATLRSRPRPIRASAGGSSPTPAARPRAPDGRRLRGRIRPTGAAPARSSLPSPTSTVRSWYCCTSPGAFSTSESIWTESANRRRPVTLTSTCRNASRNAFARSVSWSVHATSAS